MKKLYIIIIIIISTSCWGQNIVKDSLFLFDKNDYFDMRINYENQHYYFFKKEKFVTSASNGIMEEKMNHFSQSYKRIIHLKKLNSVKIVDIKEYLNKNRSELIDSLTNKYDAYKLMLHFDKFNVFIKKDNSFIKVVYVTSLSE